MKNYSIEDTIERGLFLSRWLMTPMYIGLVRGLVLLLFSFVMELAHLFMVRRFSLYLTSSG